MKIMFENTPSVHLTVFRGKIRQLETSLDSLNMLRMRGALPLFEYIIIMVMYLKAIKEARSPFKKEYLFQY